jgi:hypothetical protein
MPLPAVKILLLITLLEIKVIIFYKCFTLNCKLIAILFTVPALNKYVIYFNLCDCRLYCDVSPESRDIGARVYDRFLDNGLANRLRNSRRPFLDNGE